MKRCIAVTHVRFEDLGTFAAPLARHYTIEYRHAGATPPAPADWHDADLVVVLGGPIGAGGTAAYPWLDGELAGLRARLARGLPTLGICLGAQLMAVALGGAVARRAGMEIGWGALDLATAPGPLRALAGVPVLHWHGDNIVAPPGATVLAATPGTPCQAFQAGPHALALQYHAEFDPATLEEWLTGHAVELAHAGVDVARLRRDTAAHGAALAQAAPALLAAWLEGLQ